MDKDNNSYEFRGETLLPVVSGFDLSYESESYMMARVSDELCCGRDVMYEAATTKGDFFQMERGPIKALEALDAALVQHELEEMDKMLSRGGL